MPWKMTAALATLFFLLIVLGRMSIYDQLVTLHAYRTGRGRVPDWSLADQKLTRTPDYTMYANVGSSYILRIKHADYRFVSGVRDDGIVECSMTTVVGNVTIYSKSLIDVTNTYNQWRGAMTFQIDESMIDIVTPDLMSFDAMPDRLCIRVFGDGFSASMP
jgi:hypothetical protein